MDKIIFIKRSFVLGLGLVLPVILMLFFFTIHTILQSHASPPKYNMVFSAEDRTGTKSNQTNIVFLVKDGLLRVKPGKPDYNTQKLYMYDAKTQLAHELPLHIPVDDNNMMRINEKTIEATQHMKLDTQHQSPDGYVLSYIDHTDSTLVSKLLLWGGNGPYLNEPILIKYFSKIKLTTNKGQQTFTYSKIQFLGWVKS